MLWDYGKFRCYGRRGAATDWMYRRTGTFCVALPAVTGQVFGPTCADVVIVDKNKVRVQIPKMVQRQGLNLWRLYVRWWALPPAFIINSCSLMFNIKRFRPDPELGLRLFSDWFKSSSDLDTKQQHTLHTSWLQVFFYPECSLQGLLFTLFLWRFYLKYCQYTANRKIPLPTARGSK